ncbi:hypothetical protein SDRG_13117 [Saprolegnia diclina VS20]|uniref:UDP-N-acetylglucosamine--peptide N-acetylglucosaminyltransferase SPINDLY n=1 Tax=Saprolegnia diclina (strain VS20) TaxID=1156394 RepID=T0PUP3_SAPDV|nr:hypothetical protein SDRG_13117 [Saprolegnia diclina VS20]EQC29244.1 hypothetical protein SDRG_13117 [Saprolegnia diclina VS20]|eukprot:XP_008617422.1 hypothetical protein SDRG_13117 [Saprolegnia diclina VS20]
MADEDPLRRLSDAARTIVKQRRSTLTAVAAAEADTDNSDDDEHDLGLFAAKYHRLRHVTATMAPVERDVQAQWLWLNGKLVDAKAHFIEIARSAPTYPHVHFKLGYLYLLLHDAHKALDAFGMEVATLLATPEPTHEVHGKRVAAKAFLWCAHAGRYEAYTQLHQPEKALHEQAALEAHGGTSLEAHVAMGSLFARLGLLHRADLCFEKAAALNARDPSYLAEHASVLLLQKRYDRSLAMAVQCVAVAAPLSYDVFRAMLHQATAHIRLRQLPKAKNILREVLDSLAPLVEEHMTPLLEGSDMDRATLRQLYFDASQSDGCRALLAGDLQHALDVYYRLANDFSDFQLPVLLVAPGARNATGNVVDTSVFSVDNIVNALVYLDEMEARYGPDACLYFHRANVYRALGNLNSFLEDLKILERLAPHFLPTYFSHGSFGDFLDEETMTWLPHRLLCALHASENVAHHATRIENAPIVEYLQTRRQYQPLDIYADIFLIDGLRRLELDGELSLATKRQQEAASVSFDDSLCGLNDKTPPLTSLACIGSLLERHANLPLVHFVAGLVYMSQLRAFDATRHFGLSIELLSDALGRMEAAMQHRTGPTHVDLPTRWIYQSYARAKYHALVWRSVLHRLLLNTVEANDDLKAALALFPRDPHGQLVKAMSMVHYSQTRHAIKPLQIALDSLRANGFGKNKEMAVDYILGAGTASFSLLPGELRKARNAALHQHYTGSTPSTTHGRSSTNASKLATKILTMDALDKLYDAGVLKLSKGLIASAIEYFQALTSIKETYMTPSIEALLDLQRCRDPRLVDEKIYACHHRLSKRGLKLLKLLHMPIEGLIDMTVCLHYAPHDVDTYWHRAMLYRQFRNYDACLHDLSLALELTLNGETATKLRQVRLDRYKTLILARSDVYSVAKDPAKALSDLNVAMELHYREKTRDPTVTAAFHDKRCALLVRLRRFEQAIEDMEIALQLTTTDGPLSDNAILNHLLLGNLHCQMAMTSQKKQTISDHYLFPTPANPLTSVAAASLATACTYYDKVLSEKPTFALALFLKGRMHAVQGDCVRALGCLDDCLRQDAWFVAAHFLRGSIRAQQCLPELALAAFLLVRSKVPLYPNVQTSIGYCYYILGNHKSAVFELTEAIAQASYDATAHYTRGLALQEVLALDKAVDDFSTAIAHDTRMAPAYFQRAICRLLQQDYSGASADLRETIRLDTNMLHAYVLLGYACYHNDQVTTAVDVYSQFLLEKTTDAKVLVYRGLCYYRLGELDLALRDLHRAVKLDAKLWFGYYVLALCFHKKADVDGTAKNIALCVPYFKEVPTAASWDATPPLWHINSVFAYRGDDTTASLLRLAKYACKHSSAPHRAPRPALDATTPSPRQLYLRVLFRRTIRHVVFLSRVVREMESHTFTATSLNAHLSRQLEALAAPVRIPPPRGLFTDASVAWAYNLLGTMCHRHKKLEDALRNFTLAIAATPTNPVPYFNRGNIYLAMHAIPSALTEYTDALQANPEHVPSLINAALAFLLLHNVDDAHRYLRTATTQLPFVPDARSQVLVSYNYANVLRQLDRLDEAIEWYTKAMEHTSTDLWLLHNRATVYHAQMKFTSALHDYAAALALAPSTLETRANRAQLYIASSRCFLASQDLDIAVTYLPSSDKAALVQRLHGFCKRWTEAMTVARADFVYVLHAFPCFANVATDGTAPFLDPFFFHYSDLSDASHAASSALERMLAASKAADLPRLVHAALDAMRHMDFATAQRLLLSATYTSNLSLEELQVCLLWRAQLEFDRGNANDCLEMLQQLLLATEPRDDADRRPRDTPLPLQRWSSSLTSTQARCSIASDIYAYAGCVFQAQNKREQAKHALEKSLRLVPHNMFALLNCVHLYSLEGDLYAAMDTIARAIDFVARGVAAPSSAATTMRHAKASVLHRSHDVHASLAHTQLLTHPTCASICSTLSSLLAEYKALLTWDVGNHIPQLCALQGKLAIHAEALRDLVTKQREPETSNNNSNIQLHSLHQILDQCALETSQQPALESSAWRRLVQPTKPLRRRSMLLPNVDVPSTPAFQDEYNRVVAQIEPTLVTDQDEM